MNWQKANVLWGNFSILAIIIIVIAQILFMSCDKNDTAKIFFFFFFGLSFLGLHPGHMEVLRLGSQSEL